MVAHEHDLTAIGRRRSRQLERPVVALRQDPVLSYALLSIRDDGSDFHVDLKSFRWEANTIGLLDDATSGRVGIG